MAANAFKLRLKIDGYTEFNRAIHGAMANADDLEPLFAAIAAEVRASIAARFAAEGAADGQPAWAPLSADYAAWKAKRADRKENPLRQQILQRTGALLEAATNPTTTTTATSLTMTIENDYAIYHESRRPRGSRLPRRAFMALSGKQRARVTSLLREHLRAGLDA